MANPLEKFMHDHFVKLRQNGKKDEAHAYRKSFQVEQSTTEEVKQPLEEKTQDEIAVLRAKYTETTGKNVSPRYMNDAERLKANTKI
jgi:hypothetical protein